MAISQRSKNLIAAITMSKETFKDYMATQKEVEEKRTEKREDLAKEERTFRRKKTI